MKNLLQDITIYHKENNRWDRYYKRASVRNTFGKNRTTTGVDNTDRAIIRIFDIEGYGSRWKCNDNDVIVALKSSHSIDKAPITELRKLYGKENVFEVCSIDKFIFDDIRNKEIQHIKFGGR